MGDDFLASAASFGLVSMMLCSYAFKEAALIDLDDIQQKMSQEQRELYVVNQGTLTIITVASTIGAIIFSLILFSVQFSIEGARIRREARASRARRLRFVANDKEVRASKMQVGCFHLFLSHVWGTGQDRTGTLGIERRSQVAVSFRSSSPLPFLPYARPMVGRDAGRKAETPRNGSRLPCLFGRGR